MRSKEELLNIVNDYQNELIEKYDKLVFDREINFRKDSLYNFLLDYFKLVYKATDNYNILTYTEKDRDYDCGGQRSRSIGDLFLIARGNYNKDVTLLEVMEVMYYIMEVDRKPFHEYIGEWLCTYICNDIAKRVFWTHASSTDRFNDIYLFSNSTKTEEDYENSKEFNFQGYDYVTLFF